VLSGWCCSWCPAALYEFALARGDVLLREKCSNRSAGSSIPLGKGMKPASANEDDDDLRFRPVFDDLRFFFLRGGAIVIAACPEADGGPAPPDRGVGRYGGSLVPEYVISCQVLLESFESKRPRDDVSDGSDELTAW